MLKTKEEIKRRVKKGTWNKPANNTEISGMFSLKDQ